MPTLTIAPTADTYIIEDAPANNAGASVGLSMKVHSGFATTRIALIRFPLTDSALIGATINSVTLSLYNSDTTSVQRDCVVNQLVTTDWTEMQSNWNTRNGGTAWAGGGGFSATDEGAQLGSWSYLAATGVDTEHVITLTTSVVAGLVGGEINLSLRRTSSASGTAPTWRSRDSSVTTAQPKLTIDYTPAGGGGTAHSVGLSLVGGTQVSPTARLAMGGRASCDGGATIASASAMVFDGVSTLSGAGSLGAPASLVLSPHGDLAGIGVMMLDGQRVLGGVAGFVGQCVSMPSGHLVRSVEMDLSGSCGLVIGAISGTNHVVAISFSGTGQGDVLGWLALPGTMIVAATGGTAVAPRLALRSAVTHAGTGLSGGTGRVTSGAGVSLTANGMVVIDGRLVRAGRATMDDAVMLNMALATIIAANPRIVRLVGSVPTTPSLAGRTSVVTLPGSVPGIRLEGSIDE